MRLKIFIVRVYPPSFRVGHAQGLDSPDNDAGTGLQVSRRNPGEVGNVQHLKTAVKGRFQGFTIWVCRFIQGFESLGADRVGWDQPEHQGKLLFKVSIRRNLDGMGGKQCLSSTSRQAQTYIGHSV